MRSATATCWTYRSSWAGARGVPGLPGAVSTPASLGETLLLSSGNPTGTGRAGARLPLRLWGPSCSLSGDSEGAGLGLSGLRSVGGRWEVAGTARSASLFPASLLPSCCQLPGSHVSSRGLLTPAAGPCSGGTWDWVWISAPEPCLPAPLQIPGHLCGHHRARLPAPQQHLAHHHCGHHASGALRGRPGPSRGGGALPGGGGSACQRHPEGPGSLRLRGGGQQ